MNQKHHQDYNQIGTRGKRGVHWLRDCYIKMLEYASNVMCLRCSIGLTSGDYAGHYKRLTEEMTN